MENDSDDADGLATAHPVMAYLIGGPADGLRLLLPGDLKTYRCHLNLPSDDLVDGSGSQPTLIVAIYRYWRVRSPGISAEFRFEKFET